MNCEESRNLIIDYLYQELNPEDRVRFEKHLASCSACWSELSELKKVRATLGQYPDEDPHLKLTFVTEKKPIWWKMGEKIRSYKVIHNLAWVAAGFLILLSIANLHISLKDGNFNLQMSLLPSRSIAPGTAQLSSSEMERLKSENSAMLVNLLEDYARREKTERAVLLSELYRDFETKRQEDLKLVSYAMEQVHVGAQQRFSENEEALNALIRYVNFQSRQER